MGVGLKMIVDNKLGFGFFILLCSKMGLKAPLMFKCSMFKQIQLLK
jgi:hypothetical protein